MLSIAPGMGEWRTRQFATTSSIKGYLLLKY
nr:MAG TPA: hypothetical protein [Caudoviricetes sp.]DAP87808.1 MAG TPA: hypothetical protein [Caudoviricetes sp.]